MYPLHDSRSSHDASTCCPDTATNAKKIAQNRRERSSTATSIARVWRSLTRDSFENTLTMLHMPTFQPTAFGAAAAPSDQNEAASHSFDQPQMPTHGSRPFLVDPAALEAQAGPIQHTQ